MVHDSHGKGLRDEFSISIGGGLGHEPPSPTRQDLAIVFAVVMSRSPSVTSLFAIRSITTTHTCGISR